MTTEQPKSTPASTTEQPPYPPPHFAFAGTPYPPPGAFPPAFFAYPAPPDAQQSDSNGSTAGAQAPPPFQVMYGPPGMVYALPPPVAPVNTPPPGGSRPKRKQVKMACTNCAAACKRCDDGRPCERCQKYGIADSCVDGQRKERKKGVKRGPYKRKNKGVDGFDFPPEGAEWTVPPPSAATTAAAMHAVAQFAPPEGFYPIYYPPPGTYPPPEGQQTADGAPNAHPPPMMPLYISGFPPYPYAPPGAVFIPPPGTHPPLPPNASATTSVVAATATADAGTVPEAERKTDDGAGDSVVNGDNANHNVDPASTSANGNTKKRRHSNKSADGKAKKVRASTSRDCDEGGLSTDD